MALASNALTTLATVLDELGLSSDGGPVDARCERYINAASAMVAGHCSRTFERSASIVESVRGRGGPVLYVGRPIRNITSITLYGSAITDYVVEDADAGRIFRAIGWPSTAAASDTIMGEPELGTEDPSKIVVTYDGGYVTPAQESLPSLPRTLPFDLEDACVELAVARFRGRGQTKRAASEGYEAKSLTFGGTPIPLEILATLERYAFIPSA